MARPASWRDSTNYVLDSPSTGYPMTSQAQYSASGSPSLSYGHGPAMPYSAQSTGPHLQPSPYQGGHAASEQSAAQGNAPRPKPSTAHLNQEVKLYKTNQEREKSDNKADLFAIIQTIEHLEKAYIKDSITAAQYTPACEKLIGQYKTCMNLLKDDVPSLEAFMDECKLSCPAALGRLNIGVPATVEHGGMGEGEQKKLTMYVAETVQYFITLLDSLKLGILAVDQIHPQLNDLLESMNRIKSLAPDFVSKIKIREWLLVTNQMKAFNELSDDQARQLAFDVEQAYGAFHRSLATDA